MRHGSTFNMNHSSLYDFAQSRQRDIESAVVMADGRKEEIIDLTEENDKEEYNHRANTPSEYSPPPSPSFENWTLHPRHTSNVPLSQQTGYQRQVSGPEHLTHGTDPIPHGVYPGMMDQSIPGPSTAYWPLQSPEEQQTGPGSRITVSRILPEFPVSAHGIGQEADIEPRQPRPQLGPARRGRGARQPTTGPVSRLREGSLVAAPAEYLDHSVTRGSARLPSCGSSAVGSSSTRTTARNRRGRAGTASAEPIQSPPAAPNGQTWATASPDKPLPTPAPARRGRKRRGGSTAGSLDPGQAPDMNSTPQTIAGVSEPSPAPARKPARKRRAGAKIDPVGYDSAPPDAMNPTLEGAGGFAEPPTAPPLRGRQDRTPSDTDSVPPVPILSPTLAPAMRTQVVPSRPPSENYFDNILDRDLAALNAPAVNTEFVPMSRATHRAVGGSPVPFPNFEGEEQIVPRPTSPFEVPAHILEAYKKRPPVQANIPKRGGGLLIRQEMGQKRGRGNGRR